MPAAGRSCLDTARYQREPTAPAGTAGMWWILRERGSGDVKAGQAKCDKNPNQKIGSQ